MSYKCDYNQRCNCIKKGLRKRKTVGSEKRRQNYTCKNCKNVEFNES